VIQNNIQIENKRDRNSFSLKHLFLVGIMLLMANVGFSTEINLRILPPLDDDGTILFYCVEYRIASDAESSAGEWECIEIDYDWVDMETRGFTSCTLANLNPDTSYEIRVHPCYVVDGELCWGMYGEVIQVRTVGLLYTYIRSGLMAYPGAPDHPDLELGAMLIFPFVRVLCRRREEEGVES